MAKKDKTKKTNQAPVVETAATEISMDEFKNVSVMEESEVPKAEHVPYVAPVPKTEEEERVDEVKEEVAVSENIEVEKEAEVVTEPVSEETVVPEESETEDSVKVMKDILTEGIAAGSDIDILREIREKKEKTEESTQPVPESVKEENTVDALALARRKRNQRRVIRVHSATFNGWCHND